MRVLVVNAPHVERFVRSQRWATRTRARIMRWPDWLAYATAVLEQDGQEVKLLDCPAWGWDMARYREEVRAFRPDLVVVDSSTPSILSDIRAAAIAREECGARTLLVGPHVTSMPDDTFQRASGVVDAVARGEYDYTVRDVARAQADGRSLAGIAGLSWLKGSEVVHEADRPLIQNLDELPFPAWHQLKLDDYYDGIKLFPYIDVIGGRGCPYKCTFCLWPQVMHGHTYRVRSPRNIVDEIEHDLAQFPRLANGEFYFEDDTFTLDREHTRQICEELIGRKLDITFSVNGRADVMDEDLLKLMRKAGCRQLLVGYESANQEVLNRMKKGVRIDRVSKFTHLAAGLGFDIHGCFTLGMPGETRESLEESVRFALEHPLTTVQFSAAMPFPGTSYYDEAEADGLLEPGGWQNYLTADGEQQAIVSYPGLDRNEVTAKVDEALKRFYFRPSYAWGFLKRTRNLGDLRRKVRGATSFGGYLLKKSLRRKPRAKAAEQAATEAAQ
ncbi:MAG: radical SAM protein [Planctomycetota bacterium]